jgi:branched-subunit amino acid aminotransferase/4-amino-4-deoxychorismate lyase
MLATPIRCKRIKVTYIDCCSCQEGLAPINLIVEKEYHRATPGGTGGIKTIGNYASVMQFFKLLEL